MKLLEMMQNRRSVRQYTKEPIPEELLTEIVQAGLLSASGRGLRPWELIVVSDKEMLLKLSECRAGAAKMLANAAAEIVVIGDSELSDTWIEDCSIVLSNMHLMADSLGVGSCWIQGRLRRTPEEETTEEYVRRCLGFPEKFRLEAILSLGMPAAHGAGTELSALPMEKVHDGKF